LCIIERKKGKISYASSSSNDKLKQYNIITIPPSSRRPKSEEDPAIVCETAKRPRLPVKPFILVKQEALKYDYLNKIFHSTLQ